MIERDAAWFDDTYDVVVIGAGITGVNVTRELAGRGARVLVIDKGDFGEGTSSATTKYIHGGIRYLEQHQFGVVRESLRERRILTLAAPHLVSQRRFVMPAWRWSRPRTPTLGAGVGLYTALGFDRNREMPASMRTPLPRWWSRRQLLQRVPWLDPNGLRGAFVYHDTLNVHPERLLLALLGGAVADGARAVNHVEAVGFEVTTSADANSPGHRVTGVEVIDHIGGGRHTIRATEIVNAAGPWMDIVLERLGLPLGVRVRRSKGVHLLCRPIGGHLGTETVFARAPSGANVVISPWQEHHFIGPTDTPVDTSPDDVRALTDDVDEILATVNATVADPAQRLQPGDVDDVTVGTRPLVVERGHDTKTTSRRHEVYDHAPSGVHGLWSIAGGKWTTGRALGVEVATRVLASPRLASRAREIGAGGGFDSTHVGVLHGFGWGRDPADALDAAARDAAAAGLDARTGRHLARLYGTAYTEVLALANEDPHLRDPVGADRRDVLAQAFHAVRREGALTLSDVVDRRLTVGTVGRVDRATLEVIAGVIAEPLGWSADEVDDRIETEWRRREARRALWER